MNISHLTLPELQEFKEFNETHLRGYYDDLFFELCGLFFTGAIVSTLIFVFIKIFILCVAADFLKWIIPVLITGGIVSAMSWRWVHWVRRVTLLRLRMIKDKSRTIKKIQNRIDDLHRIR